MSAGPTQEARPSSGYLNDRVGLRSSARPSMDFFPIGTQSRPRTCGTDRTPQVLRFQVRQPDTAVTPGPRSYLGSVVQANGLSRKAAGDWKPIRKAASPVSVK